MVQCRSKICNKMKEKCMDKSIIKEYKKRAKLWVELREKYPDDEELKNLFMEDMDEKNYCFKKYGATECI